MSYTQSVIKEIRQKTPTGFSGPIYIGPEQRFVSALLNSHNNNLEEQFILGVDCLTTTWEENEIKYTTKKFFNGNLGDVSNKGYYILFIKEYDHSSTGSDFYFDGEKICFPEYNIGSASYEEIEQTEDYFLKCNNPEMYNYDEDNELFLISPTTGNILREEILCLRTNLSNTSDRQSDMDILISKKIVTQKIDAYNKIYIQEKIISQ